MPVSAVSRLLGRWWLTCAFSTVRMHARPPLLPRQEPRGRQSLVADHLGGEADARAARQEPVVGVAGDDGRIGLRGLPVGGAGDDLAEDRLGVPATGHEFDGEPVEESGIAREIPLAAELLARRHEPRAEEPLPQPVHRHSGRERIGRFDEPPRQRQAIDPAGTKTAIETVAGDGRVTGALEETRRIGYYEFDVQPPVGVTGEPIRLGMAVNREVEGATIEREPAWTDRSHEHGPFDIIGDIHGCHEEQDIRKMGGLFGKIPLTATVMWIGSLALAGVPPFAGFYSKDAIVEAAFAAHSAVGTYGFWCLIIAAFLTAFYSWRLLILTFHGKTRADRHTFDHAHESPAVMTVPLILLAIGAVTTGYFFHEQLLGEEWQHFWGAAIVNGPANHILHAMEEVPHWVSLAPTVVGLAGIAVAYLLYMALPAVPARLAATFRPVYLFLLNKWYFDELYNAVIVRPLLSAARALWQTGDAMIIDGVPNGLAAMTSGGAGRVSRLQTGSIAAYAFTMLIGLVVLISVFLLFR